MEDAGYQQSNLVTNIVEKMYQDPAYTPVPNSDPTIIPTVQPTPVSSFATYSVSNMGAPYATTSDTYAEKQNRGGRGNQQLQYL